MTSVRADLQEKQVEEIGRYQSSTLGILNSLADESHGMPGMDTSLTRLQVIGEWNNKTTDDYLDMVRKQIADNKSFQKDIAVLASQWRKAVIDEVGRAAYDNASSRLGTDLAYAYIDYRFEEQMLGKMVNDQMPKSSVEYVLRRASERSIPSLWMSPSWVAQAHGVHWQRWRVRKWYSPVWNHTGQAKTRVPRLCP